MESSEKILKINDPYVELLEDKSRHLVLYGGAGSGKSRFAAQKIIYRTLTESGHKFLCVRKVARTIKESLFEELLNAINDFGAMDYFIIFRGTHELYCTLTDSRIITAGLDDPFKIKSISGVTGMWLEEATEFTANDLDQLNLRIRGQHKHYIQYIYSFNPIDENHPIRKRFMLSPSDDVRVLHTNYKDNAFLATQDIETLEGYKETNKLYYDVYCLGLWGIVDTSNKFLYSYNSNLVTSCTVDDGLPIWLSFDFNVDPMTCICGQRLDSRHLQIFREFKINNGSTPEMCEQIDATFPNRRFIVTGDASGRSRSSLVKGSMNHWQYIKRYFALNDMQIKVRSKNLSLIDSRLLCNSVVQNSRIEIDPGCSETIDQIKFAKVDEYGVLVKDRGENKNDFLDGFRYLLDANFPQFLAKTHKRNGYTNNGSTSHNGFERGHVSTDGILIV